MAEGVEKDSLQDSLAQNESAQPFWDNFFPTTSADTTTAQPSMQVWGHLRLSNPWLPVRSRIGAFYAANKEQTMMAIHRAIERRDPFNPDQPADPQVIVELEGASLLVPVIFHSQLGHDYFTSILNGPFLKSCLKTELERVGYTEPILVTAEKQGLPHAPSLSLDEEIKDVLEKMRQATVQLSKQPKQDQTENGKSDTQTSALKQERTLIGGNGAGKSPFEYPSGVAVSEEGEIFVADCYSKRIQIFSEDSATEFITTIHGDEIIEPSDVAIDGEGKLWVVGYRNTADYAVRYTKQGKRLAMFKLQVETEWLRGIAVDVEKNHVLVTQTTGEEPNVHGEVMVFTPDGTAVRTVGGQQGMKYPRYITVDGEGRILVADSNNNCVYVYKEGQLQLKFGNTGKKKERSEGMLNNPRGLCTDSSGNVIVADSGNHRIKMFDKRGRFLKHVATDMPCPQAVAMTPQGQLVVTDTEEDTVMIFDSLLGSMKCGSERCVTCEHLEEGATFSSHATEESFQMKDSMTCRSTYIIYLVSCSKCGAQYVGETKEELRTKFSSHMASINQNKTSALAKHFNSAGHSMKNVRVRPIVQIELESHGDQLRKDEEAFWIETLQTEAPEGMNLPF
ncbi:TRIM3 [Branchiostoma lanceolatum]|uniref:TRIM3 protein n=1 Tax=Branchiostoma lanceolatum TaxID=7740 RepID=A0A8J9ZBW2_BRALA|nr:TRIM3 [Branchiostoma lanceolatum]